MYRSQYDGDVRTWSPQGRLFQVEYAMEAENQGSTVMVVRSKTHVVSVALMRRINKMADYTEKVFKLDEHAGIAFSGLAADARTLTGEMRDECINHKFTYDECLPAARLVAGVADDFAERGMGFGGGRPYGVGLITFAYDQTGSRIFYINPAGLCNEYE